MSNGTHEFSGKTVDEAIEIGLNQLGLTEGDVVIEVVNRGSRGIFGLGSEAAVIRMTPKRAIESAGPPAVDGKAVDAAPVAVSRADEAAPSTGTPTLPAQDEVDVAADEPGAPDSAPADEAIAADQTGAADASDEHAPMSVEDDELTDMAAEMLEELVSLMGFEAEVTGSWHEADENGNPYLLLDIRGDDLGALIGRRGETLASLQYLLRLMVNQRLRQWKNIVVDVEDYKQRRVKQLTGLAERMARQVTESGRSIALEPMPANERRIIHLTLRDNPDVFTESIGEGDRRKVTIAPRHT